MAFDLYQTITNNIIEQLENGVIPWHKPWHGVNDGSFNRVSKKPYSFMNQMLLKHDGEYATFKQWQSLGGKVKKDEKSEIVVFWKMHKIEETKEDGTKVSKTIPLLRYYNVFHVSQIEGVEPKELAPVVHKPIEEAEAIINAYNDRETLVMSDVKGDKAFYAPLLDYLQVPVKEQYTDINEYYSTKFHEMVHSTGHKSRLNRFEDNTKLAPFGSEDYSKEELVAEIGSAFLMGSCGADTTNTFNNSTAYIQSWLNVLKNDKRLIVSASGKAEKAVKYILGVE